MKRLFGKTDLVLAVMLAIANLGTAEAQHHRGGGHSSGSGGSWGSLFGGGGFGNSSNHHSQPAFGGGFQGNGGRNHSQPHGMPHQGGSGFQPHGSNRVPLQSGGSHPATAGSHGQHGPRSSSPPMTSRHSPPAVNRAPDRSSSIAPKPSLPQPARVPTGTKSAPIGGMTDRQRSLVTNHPPKAASSSANLKSTVHPAMKGNHPPKRTTSVRVEKPMLKGNTSSPKHPANAKTITKGQESSSRNSRLVVNHPADRSRRDQARSGKQSSLQIKNVAQNPKPKQGRTTSQGNKPVGTARLKSDKQRSVLAKSSALGLTDTNPLEQKIQGVSEGTIPVNSADIVNNIRNGQEDYGDKLAAQGAYTRILRGAATSDDRDLLTKLGGIDALRAAAEYNVHLPSDLGGGDSGLAGLSSLPVGAQVPLAIMSSIESLLTASPMSEDGVSDSAADGAGAGFGFGSTGTDLGPAVMPAEAIASENVTAASTCSLIHSGLGSTDFNFQIDGTPQSIAPGTTATVNLPESGKGEISFQTGTGTQRRYSLSSGQRYEFYAKDGAWDLRQKKTDAGDSAGSATLMMSNNDGEPLSFVVDGVSQDIAAGGIATVPFSQGTKGVISFEDGAGANRKYTLTGGQTYEFYANDDHWDLREKRPEAEAEIVREPRHSTGRFVIVNPADNEETLFFSVEGRMKSLAAGEGTVLETSMDGMSNVTFSNGENGQPVPVTVRAGKIYEFWDNGGLWDLREKVAETNDPATASKES